MYKSIKVKQEIYDWLKQIDNSPSKAIETLRTNGNKILKSKVEIEELQERIMKLEEAFQKIVNYNKLRF